MKYFLPTKWNICYPKDEIFFTHKMKYFFPKDEISFTHKMKCSYPQDEIFFTHKMKYFFPQDEIFFTHKMKYSYPQDEFFYPNIKHFLPTRWNILTHKIFFTHRTKYAQKCRLKMQTHSIKHSERNLDWKQLWILVKFKQLNIQTDLSLRAVLSGGQTN